MVPKAYQIESDANGALAMACQKAQVYIDAARAPTTRRVYAGAWRRWATWCEAMHCAPLPAAPEAVAAYLAELARSGRSLATVKGARAAIHYMHGEAGETFDAGHRAITAVLSGITRTASRPIRRATALRTDDLRALIARIDGGDVRDLRDRALLLIGFFAALRRSELVSLDVTGTRGGGSFVEIRPEGLLVHITGSKTSAATQTVAIPRRGDEMCATRALQDYLAASGLTHGPLFRPISKAGSLLGRRLDATGVRHILFARAGCKRFSPHALRAGFITSAARKGVPEHVIQRTSRHKSVDVLRGYIRGSDLFSTSAAAGL